MLTSGGSYR